MIQKTLLVLWITCFSVQLMAQAGRAVILVVNKGSHSVSVLDTETLTAIKEIPVGHAPHELATVQNGRLAYVANYGLPDYGNSISVIDITAGKEVKRISTGPFYRPHCIVAHDDRIYFTSEATRSIAAYNINNDSVNWLSGTGQEGGHMLVLTPDGKKAFVANRVSNTVTVVGIDATAWPGPIQQIVTGSKPEGIHISPDGKEVWIGNTGDGTVEVIDAITNRITRRFQAGKIPIRIQFTPDGKKVLIADAGGEELIIVDAAGKNIVKRVSAPGAPMGILVSADNKKAYIACSNARLVRVFDMTQLKFVGSIKTGEAPDGITWGYLNAQ